MFPVVLVVQKFVKLSTHKIKFKTFLTDLVKNKESKTFYKFGDGDYYFLKKQSVGSATPGKRALSKSYENIDHDQFLRGSQLSDYYTCEIYPENRNFFSEVIDRQVDFPAEYGYGLVANKWLLQTFSGKIGLIGADRKINIIKNLMKAEQYQKYLGIRKFEDYISLPQQFACDDIAATLSSFLSIIMMGLMRVCFLNLLIRGRCPWYFSKSFVCRYCYVDLVRALRSH